MFSSNYSFVWGFVLYTLCLTTHKLLHHEQELRGLTIILGGNMPAQIKPRFMREKSQIRVNFSYELTAKTSSKPRHMVAKHELQLPCTADVEAASQCFGH
jgi:hypothetical protein